MISITDIAQEHGKRRQAIHKLVNRLDIPVIKMKGDKRHGQVMSYVGESDYERLKNHLEAPNKPVTQESNSDSALFYMIQLEPKYDPGRFKVGFTTDIEQRIRDHRTSAPLLRLAGTWPCKPLWERTAIECVTQNCEQLYTEVFRADDIQEVKDLADRFFQLMPTVTA